MKPGDVTRARSHFYHGNRDVPVLVLFSERFHYVNRYRVRGEKRVVWPLSALVVLVV